jgi:hypothetical protein
VARRDSLRSQEDLIARLWEQINFLRSSAAAFDKGDEAEARRLAVTLRIFFIHSQKSKSLFEQLDVGRRLKMLNTAEPINPRNLVPTFGLVMMRMDAGGGRYIPPLGDGPSFETTQLLPLNRWLSRPVGKRGTRQWSRQDLITWVANRDGGAHIDSQLDPEHYKLSRENGMGWFSSTNDSEPEPYKGDFVLASIRQIAYEVDKTVIRHVDRGDIPSLTWF